MGEGCGAEGEEELVELDGGGGDAGGFDCVTLTAMMMAMMARMAITTPAMINFFLE